MTKSLITDRTLISKSAEDTIQTGNKISSMLNADNVLAIYGEPGTGKTQLVKGICSGLGVQETVNSPTFIIVNEYHSAQIKDIYHFDLYRIKNVKELVEMGFRDYLNPGSLVLIEWPELAEDYLPDDYIRIELQYSGDNENERKIILGK